MVEMEVGSKEDNKVALMEEDDLLSDDGETDVVDSDGDLVLTLIHQALMMKTTLKITMLLSCLMEVQN